MSLNHDTTASHPPIANQLYVGVWAALLLLTAVTVGISYLQLANITILAAMIIATLKASLVLMYFMHLRFERPLFVFMLSAALFFFTICLALTFVDYSFR